MAAKTFDAEFVCTVLSDPGDREICVRQGVSAY
jgi:hypothetical protein